jgi:glycosyltransferase involved in cell wall biosynthesis
MNIVLLSVLIPVYNEVKFISNVVDRVASAVPNIKKEIIIIDDGSTDGTREWLVSTFPYIWEDEVFDKGQVVGFLDESKGEFGSHIKRILVLLHKRNKGKGAASRTGFKAALGDVIVIQDADLEYDPRDWEEMLEPIISGQADIVIGSRFYGKPHSVFPLSQYIGNKIITYSVNILTGLRFTDVESGYKMFKREVIDRIELECDDFGIEVELVIKAAKRGYRIVETAIRYYGRRYEEGKKIRVWDGIKALWYALKYGLQRGG